ncbi:hypothetical protein BS47DRAFT_1277128, partial [Hydnum rufescens UP504]
PLLEWTHIHNEFLDALLHYDGCGDSLLVPGCPSCKAPGISGTYWCSKCLDHEMICCDCCLKWHESLPLHHVQVCNGMFFEHTTLFDMGLIIYLGHMGCLMPRDDPTLFTIIHTNGIHHVCIVFCSCAISVHPWQQLLCHAWFPATIH